MAGWGLWETRGGGKGPQASGSGWSLWWELGDWTSVWQPPGRGSHDYCTAQEAGLLRLSSIGSGRPDPHDRAAVPLSRESLLCVGDCQTRVRVILLS